MVGQGRGHGEGRGWGALWIRKKGVEGITGEGGVGCVQSLYKECGVGGHGLKSVCGWTWFEQCVWVDMV